MDNTSLREYRFNAAKEAAELWKRIYEKTVKEERVIDKSEILSKCETEFPITTSVTTSCSYCAYDEIASNKGGCTSCLGWEYDGDVSPCVYSDSPYNQYYFGHETLPELIQAAKAMVDLTHNVLIKETDIYERSSK